MSLMAKRWEELADIKRVLARRDWFPGTSGNLAIKVDDEPVSFLVKQRKQTRIFYLLTVKVYQSEKHI
jgi:ribulose-5-phosphate 4-epimerase/fuculose-1-phosphate aldolase